MRLFLTSLLCFVLLNVQAQDFKFGLKTGTGISWVNSSEEKVVEKDGNQMNFGIGLSAEYYFGDNYGVTAGLGMTFNEGGGVKFLKGGDLFEDTELKGDDVIKYNDIDFPENTFIKYRVSNVELPISFKMKTNEMGYFTYYAELPIFTLDIRTGAEGDIEVPNGGGSSDEENINDDINLFQLSWGLGAGVEYAISDETTLVGGFYYKNGIFDLNEADKSKLTPRSFNLRVAVLF